MTKHFRQVARAGAVLALTSTAAMAQSGSDITERTIEACLSSELTAEGIEERLLTVGWARSQTDQLSDEQLRSWAAYKLIEDMRFGANSEVRWQKAWELKRKAAEGLRRLVETDSLSSRGLYFVRRDSGDLLRVLINAYPVSDEVYCYFAVNPSIASKSLAPISENQLTDDMPPVVPLRPQTLSSEQPLRRFFVNMLRKDAIAESLGQEFDYIATVSTAHSMAK